jgi:hypothetical protein
MPKDTAGSDVIRADADNDADKAQPPIRRI